MTYLDAREAWWQKWPRAQKDQATTCVSCHTQLPYALVRPMLGRELGETATPAAEQAMWASVEKRVTQWPEMVPFYSDAKSGPGKTAEAHATEAVMNAVMLASYDTAAGHLRPVTRTAFQNLWALQQTTGELAGGWLWLNFHLGPWEAEEAGYQGAALVMAAAANAPDGFAREPETRQHLDRLKAYLRRGYSVQPRVNQLYVLWASGREPGLLLPAERAALIEHLAQEEEPDGGWRTAVLDKRKRTDGSAAPTASDGYATGLVVLAIEESGESIHDRMLQRGMQWLEAHQQPNGAWVAASINKQRDPASDAAPFMTDAATAYAALALERRR